MDINVLSAAKEESARVIGSALPKISSRENELFIVPLLLSCNRTPDSRRM
jgi:hypothetical protein